MAATKRAVQRAITTSDAFLARPVTASTRIRTFSTHTGNWTVPASQHFTHANRTILLPQTSSNIRNVAILAPIAAHRGFSSSPVSHHGHLDPPAPGEELKVTFIDKDGDSFTYEVKEGDNLLDIAQANDLEMEGACGGSCACSTCHVVVDSEEYYDKMEEPEDDENDMLDLAFGLTETSRLGCQVKMTKELNGLVVRLPSMTRNMQASDFEDKNKA